MSCIVVRAAPAPRPRYLSHYLRTLIVTVPPSIAWYWHIFTTLEFFAFSYSLFLHLFLAPCILEVASRVSFGSQKHKNIVLPFFCASSVRILPVRPPRTFPSSLCPLPTPVPPNPCHTMPFRPLPLPVNPPYLHIRRICCLFHVRTQLCKSVHVHSRNSVMFPVSDTYGSNAHACSVVAHDILQRG